MKTLSKEEKEIIRLIQKKEITDIYSYVKYFNLGKEVQYFKEAIQKNFDSKYGNKILTITKDKNSFINSRHVIKELPNDKYTAKPYLSYDDKPEEQTICYNAKQQITHSYTLTEPTYICEDIEKILNFISIWQFLESEHLIIELPKSCEEQDMGLFLSKEFGQISEEKYFPEDLRNTYELKVDASEFMDWRFSLNIHNFEICLPYLQKQIQPTLGLDTFVEKGFKTKSDLIERRNFIIALAGVIVAIVTSGASLIMSLLDNGNTEELNKINNSLQEIRQELDLPEENIEQQTTPTEEAKQ